MSLPQNERFQTPEFTKFFEKIRSSFNDFKIVPDQPSKPTHSGCNYKKSSEFSEEVLFGKIEKNDFEKILNAYERQQQHNDLKEKPVICDVFGRSYQKLLFSRPGFHHLRSTDHLIGELGINDVERNSFLAGISVFSSPTWEDLRSLRNRRNRMTAESYARRARDFTMKGDSHNATICIERASKLDPDCGEVLAVRAMIYLRNRDHPKAVEYFKKAIPYINSPSCSYTQGEKNRVYLEFSDALCEVGLAHYLRGDYSSAIVEFDNALFHNRDCQLAKLHKELAANQLANRPRFASSTVRPAYRK